MIDNWFAIVMILGALFYGRCKRLHAIMLTEIVLVELYLRFVPYGDQYPHYDAYYMGLSTIIAVSACVCIQSSAKGAAITSLILSVWAIVNALMFLDLDFVYFMHELIGGIIIPSFIGLAWYAATKSRTD